MTDIKTDILVVGAGASGIGAALSAAEKGASVVLLEKGDKFGGAGMFGAQGLFAAGSELQKENNIDYSPKDAYQEMMNYTHYRSNTRLTRAIINKSADTISWLSKNGLETELVNNTQEVHQNHPRVYHQYIDKFNGFQKLIDKFISNGGRLFTKTVIKKFNYTDGNIVNVVIDKDGHESTIYCQKIIFSDGGFVGNSEMVDKYLQISSKNLFSMGERKATGDGIRILAELGADTSGMGVFENHAASVVSNTDPKWHNDTIFTLTNLPFLWLNRNGERFVNEDICYDFALWGNITYTNGGYYYFILDQNTIDYLKSNQLDWTNSFERTFTTLAHTPVTHVVGPFPNIESDIQESIDKGATVVGKDVSELSKYLGCNPDTVNRNLNEYNKIISDNNDSDFGKSTEFLKFPVSKGPFYAIKAQSTTLGTIGGVSVNDNLQALDKNGRVIKNVYATGNNASGMYDTSYPTLEGISCAFAWNSGRLAGESAKATLNK
ncbi:FAD-dependent oxidoreductase [Companilactobacillus allii]|uniref:FAD-binding dehydrogenase n=1 Tax=Companilactobacillus allii TaxID=1847728 RepID=A0A1P8Q3J1_9LACO|nr:FAD-dependent oxidoreductase [Companilactobacillus allii]APX72431.1 FAD-binding dehydrogenase [Companilactobacillus allii]USQ69526.1 FAD-dependent oxidoreductase [Companilactobacillus allii]